MHKEETGVLLVLVGPSGSGKGTVLKELLRTEEKTFLSVSATTRSPRPGGRPSRKPAPPKKTPANYEAGWDWSIIKTII